MDPVDEELDGLLQPHLDIFALKFASPETPAALASAVDEAQAQFAPWLEANNFVSEAREVWNGTAAEQCSGPYFRRFDHSVVITLPCLRHEDGRTSYWVPAAIGNYGSQQAIVNVQPNISEGNSFERVWVVANAKGMKLKPWAVSKDRSREDTVVQGRFHPSFRWRWDRISGGQALGSYYTVVGSTNGPTENAPSKEVRVGGRICLVDPETMTVWGVDNPLTGIRGMEQTRLDIFLSRVLVEWKEGWYEARVISENVFTGSSQEFHEREDLSHLRSAVLAVEAKCRWCIRLGCFRPHFAASAPKLGYYGIPCCLGMPTNRVP